MRILVTNDDGYFAPGIGALATTLVEDGHDVVVAAPMEDRSGTGTGIGLALLQGGIAFDRVKIEGLDDTPAYGIHGLPALAVFAAGLGGFGPVPDLVVSGVNLGYNTGRAVMHSGTVGAALTAANFNVTGLAVSVQATEDPQWKTATTLARLIVARLPQSPPGTVVNLNVPGLPLAALQGVRRARLVTTGGAQATLVEEGDRLVLEPSLRPPTHTSESDVALVEAGYATLTPLTTVTEAAEHDAVPALEPLLGIWPRTEVAPANCPRAV